MLTGFFLSVSDHAQEGLFHEIFHEIFLHGLLDTLKIVPFLFLTYLLMEFLEHKAGDKISLALKRSGKAGPAIGGALGCIPQCGFSTAGSSFFSAGIISLGTLVAIFLSTSDEMLPVLISGKLSAVTIALIVLYKAVVGILVGFAIDLVIRLFKKKDDQPYIHDLCEDNNCHCEKGILHSAIHHTLTIGAFLLVITLAINALVFFFGDDVLSATLYDRPFVGHLVSSVIGLIPNCAVSVALTNFYVEGFITAGTMLSGLFSGAGVGLLVLFRTNKNVKQNVAVLAILVFCGVAFGMLFDTLPFPI